MCIACQGNSDPAVPTMNKTIGIQLAVYGLLLAGLSFLTYQLAPTVARPTLVAGLAGGVLCLGLGLRALEGRRSKVLPILTLILVNYVMLSQVVMTWGGKSHDVEGGRAAAGVISLLFVLSLAMTVRIAYAGFVFDRHSPNSMKDVEAQSQMTGKPALRADAVKRP